VLALDLALEMAPGLAPEMALEMALEMTDLVPASASDVLAVGASDA
jgi:hypothetical protein